MRVKSQERKNNHHSEGWVAKRTKRYHPQLNAKGMQWEWKARQEKSLGSRRELCLQSLGEGLLLTLAFHLHQVLGVLGAGVVDTALGLLLALPATGALVLVVGDGLSGVIVANTLVATVEQGIVGNVVFLNVLLDLVKDQLAMGLILMRPASSTSMTSRSPRLPPWLRRRPVRTA